MNVMIGTSVFVLVLLVLIIALIMNGTEVQEKQLIKRLRRLETAHSFSYQEKDIWSNRLIALDSENKSIAYIDRKMEKSLPLSMVRGVGIVEERENIRMELSVDGGDERGMEIHFYNAQTDDGSEREDYDELAKKWKRLIETCIVSG